MLLDNEGQRHVARDVDLGEGSCPVDLVGCLLQLPADQVDETLKVNSRSELLQEAVRLKYRGGFYEHAVDALQLAQRDFHFGKGTQDVRLEDGALLVAVKKFFELVLSFLKLTVPCHRER